MYTRKYYERQEDIRFERFVDFVAFNQWNMLT
jgi:hypothetical protein